MCLIMVCEQGRPSSAQMVAANDRNPHGIGFAWRQEGKVCWAKNVSLATAIKAAKKLPLPFVVHFRWATVGLSADLTHPFQISKKSELKDRGITKNPVLFHNGHFSDWEQLAAGLASVPAGPISDSRVLAMWASQYGEATLEYAEGQRLAVLDTEGDVRRYGKGWVASKGVWHSNQQLVKG